MWVSNAKEMTSSSVTHTNDRVHIRDASDVDVPKHASCGRRSRDAPRVQRDTRPLYLERLMQLDNCPIRKQTDEEHLAVQVLASGVDAIHSRQRLLELCQAVVQL